MRYIKLSLILLFIISSVVVNAQGPGSLTGQNLNYRVKNQLLVPITSEGGLSGLTVDQTSQVVEYMDEQGKTIQSIIVQGSPDKKDVVSVNVYDEIGRMPTRYLPMVSTASDGRYKANLLVGPSSSYINSAHYNYYTTGASASLPTDPKPYAISYYDNSPLNRLVEQGGIGEAWQKVPGNAAASKTTEYQYGTNVVDEVFNWTVSANGGGSYNLTRSYYPANVLSKVTVTDVNENLSIAYKDREGKSIMTKTQADPATWAETYYVYDSYDNLVFTLTPEMVRIIKDQSLITLSNAPVGQQLLDQNTVLNQTSSDSYLYSSTVTVTLSPPFVGQPGFELHPFSGSVLFAQYAYQYLYDNENRKIAEKTPGKAWGYLVYDKRDRLALSQDGNQRLNNEWTFTKYDSRNRPVLTGTTVLSSTVDQIRLDVLNDPDEFESYGGAIHGYTNNCYPSVSDPNQYLVATYYDDYQFKSLIGSSGYNYSGTEISGMPTSEFTRTKGLTTGGKTKILGQNTWLWSISYYDDYQQTIQSVSSNHLSGIDRVSFTYDFSGKNVKSKTSHNSSITSVTTTEEFEYDHAGRLLKNYHQVGSQPQIILNANEYNQLGKVKTKNYYSSDAGSSYYYNGAFRYSIKNWLAQFIYSSPSVFSSAYYAYDDGYFNSNVMPRYDGLISEIHHYNLWNSYFYKYFYNQSGYLKDADYVEQTPYPTNLRSEKNLSYDLNGNLKTLNRYPGGLNSSLSDDLAYDYGNGGNRLMGVTDEESSEGFNDGNTTGDDYAYDANGNLIIDRNKGITAITYNLLNRPDRVNFNDQSYIQYTYDASGVKLNQSYFNSSNQLLSKTDYVGEFVYIDDELQFIQHADGRIVPGNNENIISNPDAATLANMSIGSNVSAALQTIGTENYIKITTTNTIDAPGYQHFFNGFYLVGAQPVTVGQTFKFRVLGYRTSTTPTYLYTLFDNNDLVIGSTTLPSGSSNEDWVEFSFTVPQGAAVAFVGIAFDDEQLNDVFYVNKMSLYKSDMEYHYAQTDHLGNVLNVIQTKPSIVTYLATMETENNTSENDVNNFNGTIDTNHTLVYSVANATPGGDEVLRLDNNYRIGPNKSLKVFPGDAFNLSVTGYYEGTSGFTQAPLGTMITAVVSAMAGGSQPVIDGITNAYNTSSAGTNPGFFSLGPDQGSTKPSAFLNYILFDENYMPIAAKSFPVGNSPNVKQLVSTSFLITRPGYLFTYLSYDNLGSGSSLFVYFDDFKITDYESELVQMNEYYPFGMTSFSWTRDGEVNNKYLYQGKELDENTGWHDFGSRMYSADLGRWFATDPQNQFSSPYLAMGNTPINGVDPDGEFFWAAIPIAVKIAIAAGTAAGAYSGYKIGQANNAHGWQWLGYVGGGALIGGLSGYAGGSIAAAGGAFSNTASIAFGSTFNSVGLSVLSGGKLPVTTSFGAFSYGENNEFTYFGKKGNTSVENLGYGLGALANLGDIFAGFKPSEVQLNTEDSDLIGHSALTRVGETDPLNSIISVGPDQTGPWIFNPFKFKKGTNRWNNYVNAGDDVSKVTVKGVNLDRIIKYGARLDRGVKYNLYCSSCVSHTARALTIAGVPTIGIHPFILNAQVSLRSIGVRPSLYSHYLLNERK